MMELGTKALRLFAGILLVGGVLAWLVTSAHRGWTKTSVPRKTVDEVTGIEGVAYESRFVPGVDFVAMALLGSGLLAGISWLIHKRTVKTS